MSKSAMQTQVEEFLNDGIGLAIKGSDTSFCEYMADIMSVLELFELSFQQKNYWD